MVELSSFPDEIFTHILSFLTTSDLLIFERVCRNAKDLTIRAFRDAYGARPTHRPVNNSASDFRELACEQLRLELLYPEAVDESPAELLKEFQCECHYGTNSTLYKQAEDMLMKLRISSSHRTASWNEATAVALSAQCRYEEASQFFAAIACTDERARLTQFLATCRFGGPCFTVPDSLAEDDLVCAIRCASRFGDLDRLLLLTAKGEYWEHAVDGAASMGHIHIIEYMAKQDVGGLEKSLLQNALIDGQIELLPIIFKHYPAWFHELTTEGDLLIGALRASPNFTSCSKLLAFLIGKAKVNINAMDSKGQSAVHLAVVSRNVDFLRAILEFKPETCLLDETGQSPAELAFNSNNSEAIKLLQPDNWIPYQEKRKDAEKIIAAQRRAFCRLLVTGDFADKFPGSNVSEKLENAETQYLEANLDSRRADLWTTAFSAQVLDEYRKTVLHSELEHIFNHVRKIVQAASPIPSHPEGDPNDKDFSRIVDAISACCPSLRGPKLINAVRDVVRGISVEDINTFCRFYETPLGKRWAAGHRKKWAGETMLIMGRLGISSY